MMTNSQRTNSFTRCDTSRLRPAFTLIEMMVVIGIIGLLLVISVVVGQGVIGQAKVRQCEQLMASLDSLLTEYEAEYGSMPSFDEGSYYPPKSDENGDVRPEVAAFIEQVRGLKGADRILAALPPDQFLVRKFYYYSGTDPEGDEIENYDSSARARGVTPYAGTIDEDDRRFTVIDPWGMEIIYVHPRNREATVGDGVDQFAGYGIPANERPYFVSAGSDRVFYDEGEPEAVNDNTRKDNVYSYDAVTRPGTE